MQTITELRNEFAARASAVGLDAQCINDGAFHSEIAVIAEAPGDKEVTMKRPLVGGSGNELWKALRKYGLDRTQVYITNVSKRQVSFGNDKRNPISKHETTAWMSLLEWELAQLPNLKYILVLGNLSLQAITGKSGITNWRGSVLDVELHDGRKVRVVCTYNPAMVLREPKLEITFRMDCSKLRRVIDGRWNVTPVTTHINPSFDDAMDWLNKMQRDNEPVSYDVEAISNETACVGFANNPDEAMCINFRTLNEQAYTLDDERLIRRRMQQLVSDPDVQLIAQNGMFDASWLAFKDRIVVRKHYFDTMLAHHVLYPQLPHNLGYLTTQYTTRPFYKNEKDEWREGGDIDSFWRYNGQDCCNTWWVAQGILSELNAQQLADFFFTHVMRAQPHLVRMVVGGILVDRDLQENMKDEIGKEVLRLQKEFFDVVQRVTQLPDYEPNPNSPKQMTDLLFNKLRLVGRGTSTNKENRTRMYNHPATTDDKRDVLRAIDALAVEQKFYSTYVTTGIDDDGRLRCTYNQTGVQSAPGRLSSSGMLWRNEAGVQTGMNLQNQPERAYRLYIADPGYGLGYFDLEQAEARYVGWEARIDTWIEQYERARRDGSYDAHRALASEMFGMPYDEVPTFDRYDASKGHVIPDGKMDRDVTVRYISKRCRHGLNYRMMPDRLSAVTGLSLTSATEAYRIYHRVTPELQQWWAELEREVRQTKTLYNYYGRRLRIMERLTPEAMESIVAFKPQSSIGDKVVRVIYLSESDPRWPHNARIWLNIHDALICLAPLHKLQLCLSIMKKYAEEPMYIHGRELIIPASCKISYKDDRGYHSWANLKSVDIEAAT